MPVKELKSEAGSGAGGGTKAAGNAREPAQGKFMQKAAVAELPESSRRENPLARGREFLGEVRGEMRKVTSPSRAEVQTTTTVVILAVFLFAAFFYVIDTILGYLLQALLHALGGS